MPRLSDIQSYEIKPITVEYNGIELHFDVDPSQFTLAWQKEVSRASDEGDIDALSTTFFRLVKQWDIADDNDEVLPLDTSAFDQLTVNVFASLSQLITERMVPNGRTRRSSRK